MNAPEPAAMPAARHAPRSAASCSPPERSSPSSSSSGVVPRLVLRHRLRTDADAVRTRLPMVSTANPRRAPEVLEVPLPGSMEAILETGIWARTDGYLTGALRRHRRPRAARDSCSPTSTPRRSTSS